MSQLQYIGARYVPIWYQNSIDDSSDWEVNVEYEPMTFVTSQNNHLYLSKKQVPDNIGTPAQNTEYWLDMGYFSGSYADLQQEIQDMKDGTIDGSLQNQIDDNSSDIAQNSRDIAELKSERYFIFQGDSYALPSTYAFQTWPQLVVSYMGISSDDYTLLDNDGAGFVDTGAHGTFEDQLESSLVTADRDVTDIVVAGGANDNSYTSVEIYQAVASYINKAKTLYPKAKIHIAMVGWSRQKTAAINIWDKVYGAYKESAIAHGATYIEESSYALIVGDDFYDTSVHPNATGQIKIARALYSGLMGYPTKCVNTYTPTVTAFTGYTITDNAVSIKQFGDHLNFRWWSDTNHYIRITKSPSGTFTRSWMQIATLSEGLYIGGYLDFTVPAIVILSNSDIVSIAVSMRIVENNVYLSANYDVANTSYIQLGDISIDFPVRNIS